MHEPQNPTFAELQANIDYATRNRLLPYDDGRWWFLLTSSKLKLAQVAWSAIHDPQQLLSWINDGWVLMAPSIHQLPGEDFECIYFEDAYFLSLYEVEKCG